MSQFALDIELWPRVERFENRKLRDRLAEAFAPLDEAVCFSFLDAPPTLCPERLLQARLRFAPPIPVSEPGRG